MTRAGLYIHIPFCRSRCSYCDFATGAYEGRLAGRYVRALVSEIAAFDTARLSTAAPRDVDTVYFGGGTPSLLAPRQVEVILEAVRDKFRVDRQAEVTMEMNPGTVTPELAENFRRAGVNRASF